MHGTSFKWTGLPVTEDGRYKTEVIIPDIPGDYKIAVEIEYGPGCIKELTKTITVY